MQYRQIAQEMRVPGSFLLAFAFIFLSTPTYTLLLWGSVVAFLGIVLRIWAAGYIKKGDGLTTSGPYAYVRHPLYLGSLIIGAGFMIVGGSLIIVLLFVVYFLLFYVSAMRQEEEELRAVFRGAYEVYANQVPLLLPRLGSRFQREVPIRKPGDSNFNFSLAMRNKEYNSILGFAGAVFLVYLKIHYF